MGTVVSSLTKTKQWTAEIIDKMYTRINSTILALQVRQNDIAKNDGLVSMDIIYATFLFNEFSDNYLRKMKMVFESLNKV